MTGDELLRQLLQYRTELLGFIMAIVRNTQQAEDIFQNVALAIVKNAESEVQVAQFPAWAKQIARHHIWNFYRQQTTRKMISLPVEELAVVIDESFSVSDPTPAELTEEYEALLKCLEKLPDRSARMIRQRYISGMAYEELASKFQMKENAIRQLILRARLSLVACITSQLQLATLKGGG